MRDLIASSVGPTIEMQLRAATRDLPPALADPNQLELAILNLCVNARDAMPERRPADHRSPRRSRSGRASAPGSSPGLYVRLSVIDAGCGMDADDAGPRDRAVLFDQGIRPRHRPRPVDGPRPRRAARRRLRADQRAGRGHARRPLSAGRRRAPRRPTAAPPRDALPAIGAAAVDPAGRRRGARPLRDRRDDPRSRPRRGRSGGGAEALGTLAAGLQVDVVVTDYKMPRHGRRRALAGASQQIRPDVPILLITGYTGPTDDMSTCRASPSRSARPKSPARWPACSRTAAAARRTWCSCGRGNPGNAPDWTRFAVSDPLDGGIVTRAVTFAGGQILRCDSRPER